VLLGIHRSSRAPSLFFLRAGDPELARLLDRDALPEPRLCVPSLDLNLGSNGEGVRLLLFLRRFFSRRVPFLVDVINDPGFLLDPLIGGSNSVCELTCEKSSQTITNKSQYVALFSVSQGHRRRGH